MVVCKYICDNNNRNKRGNYKGAFKKGNIILQLKIPAVQTIPAISGHHYSML